MSKEYSESEIEHLWRIVQSHNPNDPCQNTVREIAISALKKERQLSPIGLLLLTNGASGYNSELPFPENFTEELANLRNEFNR